MLTSTVQGRCGLLGLPPDDGEHVEGAYSECPWRTARWSMRAVGVLEDDSGEVVGGHSECSQRWMAGDGEAVGVGEKTVTACTASTRGSRRDRGWVMREQSE